MTGVATGRSCDPEDVACARAAVNVPVLVGSGVTPETAPTLLEHANGLIVGSYLKEGGVWSARLDAERVGTMVRAVK